MRYLITRGFRFFWGGKKQGYAERKMSTKQNMSKMLTGINES